MKIDTIEVAGLASALTALRLPFGKEVRSKIDCNHVHNHYFNHVFVSTASVEVEQKDLELMQTLIKRGDEHAKVVRGIVAYLQVTAPVYWWCELETYRAGHERLASNSTMHQDCRGLGGAELQRAKEEIPMGKELTKVDMYSYQALRTMIKQRYNHRLPVWHKFIEHIKTLPLADELIFVGLDEQMAKHDEMWESFKDIA